MAEGDPQAATEEQPASTPEFDKRHEQLAGMILQERAERDRLAGQLGQITPIAIEQWISQQPEAERPKIKARLAQEMAQRQRQQTEAIAEERAKRIVIREAALEHGVPAAELEEIAIHLNDPNAVHSLAKRLAKGKADTSEAKAERAAARAEPALANVRPDGGGSGAPITKQTIAAKYRGSGKLQDMYQEMREHGFR